MSNGAGSVWETYLDSIREHSHQLLAWAYQDMRSQINRDSREPEITGLLCSAMQARIYNPATPDPYLHYAIGDQAPISPRGELGNERLRLDVSVRRTGVRHELVYVFEGKRLRTGGFPIGEYIGDGGMGDFISCRYGGGCPEGAMIGLWQDREVAYWIDQLRRTFEADRASPSPRLAIEENLAPVSVVSTIADELRSVHRRSDGTVIALLHCFLDCT